MSFYSRNYYFRQQNPGETVLRTDYIILKGIGKNPLTYNIKLFLDVSVLLI